MKRFQTMLILVVLIFGLFGIAICMSCFISVIGSQKNQPAFFVNKATAVVVSESMLPTLKVDDHVLIERVDKTEDLIVGEIYIYQKNDILIIHRLVADYYDVETDEFLYIFKGDNNSHYDAPVRKEDVIAKAIGVT